jgi:transposase
MVMYTKKFRMRMVSRMVGENALSAAALGRKVGVPQATLSRWRRDSSMYGTMKIEKNKGTKSEIKKTSRNGARWTPEEKFRVVAEASNLEVEELGAYLRKEGFHEAQLNEWQATFLSAFKKGTGKSNGSEERKRIRQLERELQRKEKALAEAAALLVLSKKCQALWGGEGYDISEKNEKK